MDICSDSVDTGQLWKMGRVWKLKKIFSVITWVVVELACFYETAVYALWFKQIIMVYSKSIVLSILWN